MDAVLCDELIEEIFQKVPSSSSVSLVSKRWLNLYRTSKTSLSLLLNDASLSSLSHFPSLSSLSILAGDSTSAIFSDQILLKIGTFCSKLHTLRFMAAPVSLSSLVSLSSSCPHLTSISISLSRPLIFHWLLHFPSLKSLSISVSETQINLFENDDSDSEAELGLESLSLSGLRVDDSGTDWLWRSCKKLQKLHLRSCDGIGHGGAWASLSHCLPELREVELRTCRNIVSGVLSKLAENCSKLTSLLVYDGGSKESLLRFISNCRSSNLQSLDFRLPLDLNNEHLSAIATSLRNLNSLRLQSCCLVTGEGLKAIGAELSSNLEELALINCDVVERESGLLATLGQNLRRLRKLDLSYNDMLIDKDFISMIVSCNCLTELNLRGCKKLTGAAIFAAVKSCKNLERIDIANCVGIEVETVELCVVNLRKLKQVKVEEDKISEITRTWASRRFVEVVV